MGASFRPKTRAEAMVRPIFQEALSPVLEGKPPNTAP